MLSVAFDQFNVAPVEVMLYVISPAFPGFGATTSAELACAATSSRVERRVRYTNVKENKLLREKAQRFETRCTGRCDLWIPLMAGSHEWQSDYQRGLHAGVHIFLRDRACRSPFLPATR